MLQVLKQIIFFYNIIFIFSSETLFYFIFRNYINFINRLTYRLSCVNILYVKMFQAIASNNSLIDEKTNHELLKFTDNAPWNINDIRIEIKIPANREDLLSEMIFIEELATVFLLNLYETWKNLKKEYFFLLKKNYFQYSSYSINLIDSEFQDILTYAIKINSYDTVEVPKWISKKLNKVDLKANNLIESLIELTIFEWGQNYNSLFDNNNKLIIKRSQTDDFILINNDPKDAEKDYNPEEIKKRFFDTTKSVGKPKSPEEIAKSVREKEQLNQDIKDLLSVDRSFDTLDQAKQKINQFI